MSELEKKEEVQSKHSGSVSELSAVVMLPNANTWIKKSNRLPEDNQRVLAHSPCYEGRDLCMEYRMMSGEFVRLATDVESWMIPACSHGKCACHADADTNPPQPDCVWDYGDIEDCVFASKGVKKDNCEHWRAT